MDLDAFARRASLESLKFNTKPIMLTLDIGAAFASVARSWLWAALTMCGLPAGFINTLRAAYTYAWCYSRSGRSMFRIESGIMQGCPTSGLVWALLSHPFIEAIRRRLERVNRNPELSAASLAAGWIRACADDIGIVLRDLADLPVVENIMRRIGRGAHLQLKAKKCVIVPLWQAFDEETRRYTRRRLAKRGTPMEGFCHCERGRLPRHHP